MVVAQKEINPGDRVPLSGAFFCPQSRAPDPDYLAGLYAFLSRHRHGQTLLGEIANLKTDGTWTIFAAASDGVRALNQGPRYLGLLRDWALEGVSEPLSSVRSGIVALPLLAILQIGQYLRYLEFHQLSHQELLEEVRDVGGLQGYCGGLPAAMAIACARDEAEVVKHTATVVRILVGVGAYGEAADGTREEDGSTTLALRLKYEGQGDELTRQFPGTHVSAITEPRSVSIAGPAGTLDRLYRFAKNQGLQVQKMEVRGNVHNPDNAQLAAELSRLCLQTRNLQLPEVSRLQVPVRSNRTAEIFQNSSSITEEIVTTILASRCEWFSLLSQVAQDLTQSERTSHSFVIFGMTDCVPLSPFHRQSLRVTKTDAHGLIERVLVPKRGSSIGRPPILPDDAIAVVGASCRLPGANDLEELWDLLAKETDCHRELPTDRFDLPGSFRASQNANFARERKFYGNMLDDVKRFDNAFFKLSAREVANMDPQQRILLELSYEALESAGYLATHTREQGDDVGCFIGASFVEYLDNTNAHSPTAYTSTGTIRAFLCGRISHYYGWSGPAEVLDTACSSSLVAIHRACRAIQGGECRMALTGGINIITGINNYLDLAKAGFLSPTGQCKPFDASADGYCRSDGAGLVVLKSLKQAIADGDQILGVIPAAATNQGGLSSSITVPQPTAQQALYRTVLKRAGLGPEHVSYVEAHGTGTQAGDPLEMESIRAVLAKDNTGSPRQDTLYIGSVKGNIGHCETAAGVAGLLKVLAMLKHGQIPAQASHSKLNPKIAPLEVDHLAISRSLRDWDALFRAGLVSSYGAAGSNCALLCCEMPLDRGSGLVTTKGQTKDVSFPLLLSAASEQGLQNNARALAAYLRSGAAAYLSLADVVFTLNQRRQRLKYFASITAKTVEDAAAQLSTMTSTINNSSSIFQITPNTKPAVLVFSGQTDNTIALDRSVYDQSPIFRSYIDSCDDELQKLGYAPLIPAIFQTQPISDTATLQCGLFAVQYTCARCWMDAGLRPSAVVGHSLGELTALCVSGVLSLPDAIKLVAARGRLVETHWGDDKGAMLALGCSVDEFDGISRLLLQKGGAREGLEIACYNGPTSLVAVGPSATIAAAEDVLRTEQSLQGIRFQRLSTSHGFHSVLVDPILDGLAAVSESLTWNEPRIPLQTCTADVLRSVKKEYSVVKHAREPVFFSEAVRRLEDSLGPCLWMEAGMDTPIINMVRRAVRQPDVHSFQGMKTRIQAATVTQLSFDGVSDVVSSLWKSGLFLSHWSFLSPADSGKAGGRKQIWLPPYQFQRTGHWLPNIDRVVEAQQRFNSNPPRESPPPPPPLLVTRKETGNQTPGVTEFVINTQTQRFQKLVGGHAVRSRPLCPASMYAECATMAVQQLLPNSLTGNDTGLVLEQVRFLAPLGAEPAGEVTLRLEQTPHNEPQQQPTATTKSWKFSISTTTTTPKPPNPKPTLHATGTITLLPHPTAPGSTLATLQRLTSSALDRVSASPQADRLLSRRAYALFARVVDYSPFFHGMQSVTLLDEQEAVATVALPAGQPGREESTAWGVCDAVLLDACIQVVGLLVNSGGGLVGREEVAVMVGLERAVVAPGACDDNDVGGLRRRVYAKLEAVDGQQQQFVGDVLVFDEGGRMVAALCGCRFAKMLISKLERVLDSAGPVKQQQVVGLNSASLGSFAAGAGTGTGTEVSSINLTPPSTSTPSAHEPSDSGHGLSALRDMIAEYTGLDGSAVPADTVLSDLGLDSLASVEMAEQLTSTLGLAIDADGLAMATLNDLARRLGHSSGGASRELSPYPKPNEPEAEEPSSHLVEYGKLLSILSELSGAKVQDIEPTHALVDLGIDSLSLVELQDSLRDSFSVQLDDLVADNTVQELMTQLGIVGHAARSDRNRGEPSLAVAVDSTVPEKDDQLEGAGLILENPFDALESSNAHFNTSAGKREFLGYWATVAPLQDELTVAYIVEAFSALGVNLRQIPSGQQVPQVPHLTQKHDRLMTRLWDILQRHNLVSVDQAGNRARGSGQIHALSSAELHDALQARYPSIKDEADLMSLTGPRLADCLTGTTDPVSLMFGNSTSLKIMENYYSQSPMLSTMTEQLVIFLMALLKGTANSRTRPMRILEVGAGTGGTTRRLAEAFVSAGISVQYVFTDISPGLVSKAKGKFKHYPWIEYATLDLEKEIPAKFRNQFDVVIGTNCVHATTDRTASCRRLRDTLAVGGVLVLSEVTRVIDWYDIAFGLLDGWWVAEGRTAYPLQPAEWWMSTFRTAGFACASYSRGATPEANTQRLLVACTKQWLSPTGDYGITASPSEKEGTFRLETMVYKEVSGVKIHADVYFPRRPGKAPMPIALMIHGGGYMTLSRKAIRPAQTRHLLANGFLPVSIDYRLCPEVNIIEGPIADVCSAYGWAKAMLPQIAAEKGFSVDGTKVVVIGWSTGGQLAVSLGWTAREAGMEAPLAVLSFYAPYDFESGELDSPRLASLPGRKMNLERIIAALPHTPITEYDHSSQGDTTNLGWVRPGDPRSELVLALFKEGIGLPLLLNGLSLSPTSSLHNGDNNNNNDKNDNSSLLTKLLTPPNPELIKSINPLSRVSRGEYRVPTYVIHGTADEVAPFEAAERFVAELRARGVQCGFTAVAGGRHIHDVGVDVGSKEWEEGGLRVGYGFLFDAVVDGTGGRGVES